ncbi:unnamed protein product [Nippostrongylus brasiliensis]|uniref:SPX domain-containing protein n=1 Tax=Nippostrongylus brasiliensis TaxID=27835 RepID=A0A0N4XZ31_NIPBR|nr:unnamed protein product [Nippostrongylus brasiliensis]
MPPKKSVVTSDTPTWLKPSLERWNDYFLRLDKLFDVFLSIQKAQMAILDRISCIEFNLEAADHGSSTQQHSAHYTALVKFKKDSKIVDDKASRITWVGVGEKASEEATRAFDVEAIKEVVTASADLGNEGASNKPDLSDYADWHFVLIFVQFSAICFDREGVLENSELKIESSLPFTLLRYCFC